MRTASGVGLLDLRAQRRLISMTPAWLSGLAAFSVTWVLGLYWLSALGVGVAVFSLARLIMDAGRDLPIEALIMSLASIQWIVAPLMVYLGLSDHYKYRMYVPEDEYMLLAVPGVIMLGIGLDLMRFRGRTFFLDYSAQVTRMIVDRSPELPLYLIGIGVIFSYAAGQVPAALAFPVYLLSNVKYIGLVYLIFSDWLVAKRLPLLIAFVLTFMSSLQAAMFHDLLLWSAFVGMYAALVLRPSLQQKLLVFVIQVAKDEYRQSLETQGRQDVVGQFFAAVDDELFQGESVLEGNIGEVVNRFNQGWIISRIMLMVPDAVPHAEGETIETAVKASLLPRFLYPDKPIAGGRVNYEKYTGFTLTSATSMGISLLGEAYINYGVQGAWLFMGVFGLAAGFVINFLIRLAQRYPTIWLWLPLVFLHFIKAETELLVQLNFLTKSLILVLAFVIANRIAFRWRL
jgi:hypothetical protein